MRKESEGFMADDIIDDIGTWMLLLDSRGVDSRWASPDNVSKLMIMKELRMLRMEVRIASKRLEKA